MTRARPGGKRISREQIAKEKAAEQKARDRASGIKPTPSQVPWEDMSSAQRRAHRLWTLGGLHARMEGFVERGTINQDEAEQIKSILKAARERHINEPKESYSNER